MTTALAALQAALAAENAAVYGYGVAGAHMNGDQQAAAQGYWTKHREARDALTEMITALGAAPVAALAVYALPVTADSTASAAALATALEDEVTAAYLGLVAVASQHLRRYGALAMQDSAVRAAYWRGSTEAFPGLLGGLLGGLVVLAWCAPCRPRDTPERPIDRDPSNPTHHTTLADNAEVRH